MLYENIEYADDSVVRFGNSNSKLVLKMKVMRMGDLMDSLL